MPEYTYIAKSQTGETKKGKIFAKDLKDLYTILKSQGYVLISAKSQKKRGKITISFFGRVSLKEKLMFTRNLEVMIEAGVPLPRAIQTLQRQTKSKYFKKVLLEIKEAIIKGENFSSAIAHYPKIFPQLYCSMVKVGEKTGGLTRSLKVLAFHLERSFKVRSKVKGALMYPVIVVVAMILVGVVMLVKVVPQLSEAFEALGIELPTITKIVIEAGNLLAKNWHLLLAILIGIPFLLIFLMKRKSTRRIIDRILLKIPLVSSLIRKINTAYTARTLSSLIQGGVSIVEAMEITPHSVSNTLFKESLKIAKEEIKKGRKLSEVLEKFPEIYPPVFLQMIQVGEETGETSQVLAKLADFLEEEVTNTTQNLSSVIEPILLLLIGGVIAVFAISMIKPIYSMMG
ncbi:MAG: type II secretion system F family protein, partial [Candidatus Pacebacteria bacterium]|nr:type II secretion system F family protein [Candidatus Paceibacterota bacterium]